MFNSIKNIALYLKNGPSPSTVVSGSISNTKMNLLLAHASRESAEASVSMLTKRIGRLVTSSSDDKKISKKIEKELAEARRDLLKAESSHEEAEASIDMYSKRMARLADYQAADNHTALSGQPELGDVIENHTTNLKQVI